ncbi:MAG: outer membrane protein transport protein, partial [Candidatus Omnitrophica bacterium]|nr:outer membrane protein transport protein [Candidatus Omnitrophota bacterium]
MIKKICLTILLLQYYCFSQGYRNPPPGTISLMNAGAFTAQADDASACVLNPAGLVLLKKSQIQTGILGLFSETKYLGNMISTEKKNNFAVLGNIYVGFVPEKSNLRFGFGITSPYGQQIQWHRQITETFWAYNVPYYGEMKFVTVTSSIALPITKTISLGSGIDIHRSFVETRQSVPWSFITQTPDGTATLKGEDVAASFRIGIHYHKKNHSLGLTWSSPFEASYTGTFSMTNFPSALPPFLQGIQPSVKSTFTIKFPEIYSLGYRWKNEKLAVQLGLESVKYSCLKKIVVDAGPDSLLIPPLIKNWQDVWNYSAGIEYNLNRKCRLNAAIGFIQSPVPDDTFEPTLPDADRFIYSAGINFSTASGKISLFYIYNQFK